ncbi:TPA: hypothetical protein MD887_005030 [Klebsiella oxytoca]|nr:hypothetical protein [Klebsiella oxytoca]
MANEVLKWCLSVVASAGFIGGIGFIARESLGKLLTKSIDHKFETELEKFKSDIREGEKELEQIRSYISSLRTNRDSVLQSKKFESAENLIAIRQFLSSFTMAVQYMQMLKVDEIIKMGDDQNINNFMEAITKPLNINKKMEEYSKFNKDIMKLYLNDNTIKAFEIYETIMTYALISLQLLSIPMSRKYNILKDGSLSKKIIEVVPSSKEGFDKFGENYVYYWHDYFYADVLKKLREELIGEVNMNNDTKSAERLALDFKKAQVNIQKSLRENGLPQNLLNKDVINDKE